MKTFRKTVAALGTIAVFYCAAVAQTASSPRLVRFSAQTALTAQEKSLQTVEFALYSDKAGGDPLWSEVQVISLDKGRFTVLLGSSQPEGLPVQLFATGQALWLEWRIAGQPVFPRTRLLAVPYALSAANAETLAGHSISDFVMSQSTAQKSAETKIKNRNRRSAGSRPPKFSSPISSFPYRLRVFISAGCVVSRPKGPV